jgi:hypothetical protein
MKIPFYLLKVNKFNLIDIELRAIEKNSFLDDCDFNMLKGTSQNPSNEKKWLTNYFNLKYVPSTSELHLSFPEHFLFRTKIHINLADSIFSQKTSSFPFFYYAILKNPIKKFVLSQDTQTLYIYLQTYTKNINRTKNTQSALYFKTYFIGEPFIKFNATQEEFQSDLQKFEEILRKDIKKFEEIVKFFGRR